jgi:hypothetical protein
MQRHVGKQADTRIREIADRSPRQKGFFFIGRVLAVVIKDRYRHRHSFVLPHYWRCRFLHENTPSNMSSWLILRQRGHLVHVRSVAFRPLLTKGLALSGNPFLVLIAKKIAACQLELQMIRRSHNPTFAFKERMGFVVIIMQSMHHVQETDISKAFCCLAFK